jgi:hypothetical protein
MSTEEGWFIDNYERTFEQIFARYDKEDMELPLSQPRMKEATQYEFNDHRKRSLEISDRYEIEYRELIQKYRRNYGCALFDRKLSERNLGWHLKLWGPIENQAPPSKHDYGNNTIRTEIGWPTFTN